MHNPQDEHDDLKFSMDATYIVAEIRDRDPLFAAYKQFLIDRFVLNPYTILITLIANR